MFFHTSLTWHLYCRIDGEVGSKVRTVGVVTGMLLKTRFPHRFTLLPAMLGMFMYRGGIQWGKFDDELKCYIYPSQVMHGIDTVVVHFT